MRRAVRAALGAYRPRHRVGRPRDVANGLLHPRQRGLVADAHHRRLVVDRDHVALGPATHHTDAATLAEGDELDRVGLAQHAQQNHIRLAGKGLQAR